MIANIKILEKYCKNYTKIENYQEALKSTLKYDLHHRREISENKSRKQLIAENLYYHRSPEELIFLEHGEHTRLHNANMSEETKLKISKSNKNPSAETRQKKSVANKGEKNPMFGKHLSAETRKKISEAMKGKPGTMLGKPGPWKGKNLSTETRKKMSESQKGKPKSVETKQKLSDAKKGLHWHLENGHRIWTD